MRSLYGLLTASEVATLDVGGPTAGVIQASSSIFVSFSVFFFIFQVVDQVKKIQGAPDTAHQKKGSQYNEAWEAIRSHIIKRRPEDIYKS